MAKLTARQEVILKSAGAIETIATNGRANFFVLLSLETTDVVNLEKAVSFILTDNDNNVVATGMISPGQVYTLKSDTFTTILLSTNSPFNHTALVSFGEGNYDDTSTEFASTELVEIAENTKEIKNSNDLIAFNTFKLDDITDNTKALEVSNDLINTNLSNKFFGKIPFFHANYNVTTNGGQLAYLQDGEGYYNVSISLLEPIPDNIKIFSTLTTLGRNSDGGTIIAKRCFTISNARPSELIEFYAPPIMNQALTIAAIPIGGVLITSINATISFYKT